MRRLRGFTMVELAIVMAIIVVLTVPFLDLVVTLYREARSISMQADLKSDAEGAAYRIFRRAALGPCRLAPDNHGLTFADGSTARFDGHALVLADRHGRRPLTEHPVTDFTATRRDGVLTLHLDLDSPAHAGGRAEPRPFFFDRRTP